MRLIIAALILTLAGLDAAIALQEDQIVVTGSRVRRADLGTQPGGQSVPHIHLVRRADNFLVQVTLLSDTREEDLRHEEVRSTLAAMLGAAASNPAITVVMMGDGLVDLDPDMIEQVAIQEHSRREDVSIVTLYLKTPVRDEDDFDDADNRIAAFVDGLSATGRAEINPSASYSLTLTGGADQYRDDVVRAIASDVRFLRSTFGNDYTITLNTNLHERVRLTQSGPLELSIYLPYSTAIRLSED